MARASGDHPVLSDLGHREVINVQCQCGHITQIPPFKLIGFKDLTPGTPVWALQERFRCVKCKRRPPKMMWVAKWQD
jgi:hypothetical protein